jgi:hypothetical protein
LMYTIAEMVCIYTLGLQVWSIMRDSKMRLIYRSKHLFDHHHV